jgi:hypothetical protein
MALKSSINTSNRDAATYKCQAPRPAQRALWPFGLHWRTASQHVSQLQQLLQSPCLMRTL